MADEYTQDFYNEEAEEESFADGGLTPEQFLKALGCSESSEKRKYTRKGSDNVTPLKLDEVAISLEKVCKAIEEWEYKESERLRVITRLWASVSVLKEAVAEEVERRRNENGR